MFDQQEFIARIQKIMNYYSLTASALADQLGVLRSSISHLLSERNKPSLDFVLKIVNKYPEIDFTVRELSLRKKFKIQKNLFLMKSFFLLH